MSNRLDTANVGSYKGADQKHSYTYDTGVVVVPIAGTAAGHRLIRLHGGLGMRRVAWTSSRTGAPPIVPTMEDTTGDTFLGGTIAPALPRPSVTNKGYDWTVSGEYVYVQNTPRVVGADPFPVGQHPYLCYDQAAAADAILPNGAAASAYINDGFAGVMGAAEAATPINPDGSYSWPFLGLPTAFTSSHILQD